MPKNRNNYLDINKLDGFYPNTVLLKKNIQKLLQNILTNNLQIFNPIFAFIQFV